MKALRRNFFLILLLTFGIAGIVGRYLLKALLETENLGWYTGIPIFFVCLGVFMLIALKACEKMSNNQILNIYLSLHVLKLLATVIFMMVYVYFIHDHTKSFLLTICAFYVIFVVWETSFYFGFEKELKRNKEKDEKLTK